MTKKRMRRAVVVEWDCRRAVKGKNGRWTDMLLRDEDNRYSMSR